MNAAVVSSVQEAVLATTLYERVAVKIPGLYVAVVFPTAIHGPVGEVDVIHCKLAETECPVSVNVPGDVLVQTAFVPLIKPATGAGFTVIIAAIEFTTVQLPLCTTAR